MMLAVLLMIILVLVLTFLAFVLWVARLLSRVYAADTESHLVCLAFIKDAISKHHDAVLLRSLADEYDAVENQAVLDRMRWERSEDNDHRVTIPAQWLRMQADRLDPPRRDAEGTEYNFAGERLV